MPTESLEMNGDADRNGEAEVPLRRRFRRLQGPEGPQGPLNMNHYANKKSAAESMLDVALLMANASQLKAVLEQGPDFTFYVVLITLISISLVLQILVGVLLIFIVKWNLNDESMHYRLNFLENVVTSFVFIIVVVNVFVTAFGVQQPKTYG
ncbi:ninjurin-1 [Labrus bergylta]|uniref:Ninjurin 1 n=1 Tax=Labrus bergylta TaxID=56723 RepID=A0A3Q3E5W0_9LABR|nr:ninjurin-1-like [Labrus bergylta]